MDQAREAFEKALVLYPSLAQVKNAMLPMTEVVMVPPAPTIAETAWQLLGQDAEGDGRIPVLPDGQALYLYHDARTDSLWFRLDLAQLPEGSAVGVNLAFDLDHDQETGMAWWGQNRAFTFDRLVTLWVVRDADGYRGVAGLSEAAHVAQQRYTALAAGNIAFSADPRYGAWVVGFKRADLGGASSFCMNATVGTNTQWNDDLANEGCFEVVLDH